MNRARQFRGENDFPITTAASLDGLPFPSRKDGNERANPGKKAGSLFEPPYGTLKDYPLSYNSRGVNTVKAIYPGSFDPVTNGHLDLIARGSRIFDHLVVAILSNSSKNPLFTVEERVEMLKEATRSLGNVSIATFDGLMVDFARQVDASAVLRGIRAISDYEHEFQMALMNRRLAPEVETVFLQPAGRYSFVSSRMVKEVFSFGGDITGLVPPNVLKRLRARIKKGAN